MSDILDAEALVDQDGRVTATIINETDIPTRAIMQDGWMPDRQGETLMDALVKWTTRVIGPSGGNRRHGTLFDRDLFVCPDNPYDQMRVAYNAADDNIVGSFLDASEALAFSSIKIECDDADEADVWAQIVDDIDLDFRMREIWRELNITSTATVAVWFGQKDYKVSGKSQEGIKRKKTYNNLTVPLGVTVLDPLKIVPMGAFLFNQPTLCWYADPTERDIIDSWLLGDDASGADPIMERLIMAKFEPDYRDRKELGNLGVDPNRLYVLNPQYVFNITTTRPGYARFAPLRMKRAFKLLDLKNQLQASDRALLMGSGNFIVLVKKGTDKIPAKEMEVSALRESVRSIGRTAVIVGDHRLSVEIIQPKTDDTINEAKYGTIDLALQDTLWGMFVTTHAGRDDSLKLARVVAKGLESRRAMQKRAIMRGIFWPTYNLNDALTMKPDMVFHPKRIALDFDPSLATFILDLADRGIISHSSTLAEVDFEMAVEARKRQVELEMYDESMPPPEVQWASEQMIGKGKKWAPAPPVLDPNKAGIAGSTNSPSRAGKSQGGNHGQGGNGSKGRGAGQAPKNGGVAPTPTPVPNHGGSYTPPGSAAATGIRSRPKLEQTTTELEEDILEQLDFEE